MLLPHYSQYKEFLFAGKSAQQNWFAKGAQELDNAARRAAEEGVTTPADKKGDSSSNNPK